MGEESGSVHAWLWLYLIQPGILWDGPLFTEYWDGFMLSIMSLSTETGTAVFCFHFYPLATNRTIKVLKFKVS